NKYSKSFKVPLYLRTANSYDGKGSHRIFIPYFQLLIQMNKILLFLLGGCIIGSAITIFSAQNKQKKIPTQQNAESKQNTQQEDRISTISPNILLGFHLGMSKLEYNSLIKQYKNSGKMSIWDNNTYCMHWFETQNITVHDNSVGNFTSTQSFSINL
ncbi:MAG: hypothetical protein U0L86_09455, partial [Alistipes finegoldii]|nr:hypothetical protein [Alistipes finegoldii]